MKKPCEHKFAHAELRSRAYDTGIIGVPCHECGGMAHRIWPEDGGPCNHRAIDDLFYNDPHLMQTTCTTCNETVLR